MHKTGGEVSLFDAGRTWRDVNKLIKINKSVNIISVYVKGRMNVGVERKPVFKLN